MVNRSRSLSAVLVTVCALIALAGCGTPQATVAPATAAKASAPEIGIVGQEKWFNSAPLTLTGLRGTPVFLVFWSDI